MSQQLHIDDFGQRLENARKDQYNSDFKAQLNRISQLIGRSIRKKSDIITRPNFQELAKRIEEIEDFSLHIASARALAQMSQWYEDTPTYFHKLNYTQLLAVEQKCNDLKLDERAMYRMLQDEWQRRCELFNTLQPVFYSDVDQSNFMSAFKSINNRTLNLEYNVQRHNILIDCQVKRYFTQRSDGRYEARQPISQKQKREEAYLNKVRNQLYTLDLSSLLRVAHEYPEAFSAQLGNVEAKLIELEELGYKTIVVRSKTQKKKLYMSDIAFIYSNYGFKESRPSREQIKSQLSLILDEALQTYRERQRLKGLTEQRELSSSAAHRMGIVWQRHDKETEYLERLGLRGVQFGNWVTQAERRSHIVNCYEAIKDLALVLGVKENFLSDREHPEQSLGIAFGARGRGRSSAHYEPKLHVINLTREKSYGTLAHELAHAIDFIAGKQLFGASNTSSLFASRNNLTQRLKNAFDTAYDLDRATYFQRCQKFDDDPLKPYWSSAHEMFARAFEKHVYTELKEKGMRNDYLVRNPQRLFESDAYPTDREIRCYKPLFEEFFETLKEENILEAFDYQLAELSYSADTQNLANTLTEGEQLSFGSFL